MPALVPTFPSGFLRLRLVGQAQCVRVDGRVVVLEPKDALLLAYLAIVGVTRRKLLAERLWPEVPPARAGANLRQRLLRLRKSIGCELLVGTAVASLRPDVHIDVRVGGLDNDVSGAPCSDELLAGVTASDAGGLAAWLDTEREHRRARKAQALADLASSHEAAGQLAPALAAAQQLLELEPTSEHAHRRLMRLHYRRGDRAAALAAFDRCCDVLERVLGVAPEPETETLRRHLVALAPAAAPDSAGLRVARPLPVSVLRPPRLIGRTRELGVLIDAWLVAQPAVVVGEAGLGKSRLLDALIQQRPGAVRCAGRPGDGALPYTTLARMIQAVLARAGSDGAQTMAALPQALRSELARVLPEWSDGDAPSPRGGQRVALQAEIRSLLHAQPVFEGLVIDDLHFADPASLQMLRTLIAADATAAADVGAMTATPSRPLAWTLAYRPAVAGTPLAAFHDALLDSAVPARRVVMSPLDEREIAHLIDTLELPGVRGVDLAGRLRRRTGGNPLFVLETLKQAWSEDALAALQAGAAMTRPQTVEQMIERRLSQLSAPALTLARLAAVAAPDFRIELAEAVLGHPAMQLASAWNELESAQVLRDADFAHDLVYETTLASVPRGIARHTHAAVARWLAGHAGEPARIAAHWIAAGEDAAAVAPLREAARRSTARTFIAPARELIEQADRLCGACTAQGVALEPGVAFGVMFELHQNYIVDDPGAAHEALIERLQAVAGSETEHLDAAWARHNLRRFRQTTSPVAELEADVARAERLGDRRILAALVTMLVSGYLVLGRPDDASAVLARQGSLFEQGAQRAELADFVGNLADLLGEQDRFDESLRHLARAADLYREAGEPGEVMVMLCNRTRHLRQQGRIVAAQAVFDQVDRWHQTSAPNPRAWLVSRAGACEVLRELGRYRESLARLDQPLDEVRLHMGRLYAAFPLARAKLWLALGQHARARQSVADMGEDWSALPDWLQARCGLAAAQVGARIAGGGECDRPGDADWQRLDAATRLAPRALRRSAWFECELQRAAWLAPIEGAALAARIDTAAREHRMLGYAQQAQLCAAEQLLAAGQTGASLQRVRSVLAGQSHCFDAGPAPEPVHPGGGSEAARDLVIARVLLAADEADARPFIEQARQRLARQAEQHVPVEFQASFRDRHPVQRAWRTLLGRAAR
ncbi:MAG: BTAD domain-containing putative transcriptional regulator [Burkholderiaceae bacterium]